MITLWSIVIGIFFLCYFLTMRNAAKHFGYRSLLDFRWYDWLYGFVLSFLYGLLTTMFILCILFFVTIAYVSINGCKGTEQKAQAFEQAFEQECFNKGGILNKALYSKYTTCTLKGE